MSEVETCSNPSCGKKFGLSEIGGQMPGSKESEEITCPYCSYTVTRRSNGVFQTHELPKDQQ